MCASKEEQNGLGPTAVRLRELLDVGNASAAKAMAVSLLERHPEDPDAQSFAAGAMIDAGAVLGEREPVERGVEVIEALLLRDLGASVKASLEYNLSNGHSVRATILRKLGQESEADEALQTQKALLQDILLHEADVVPELYPNVLTNYANLLDVLGRSFEALDVFADCLRVSPQHAVAMANRSHTLWRSIRASSTHQIANLRESWCLLKRACSLEREVVSTAGRAALSCYRDRLERLEAEISTRVEGGLNALEQVEALPGIQCSEWSQVVAKDRLFITFYQPIAPSAEHVGDDAFFERLVSRNSGEGDQRFKTLANYMNALKEDFVTARYLFYHRGEDPDVLARRGAMTLYADTLEYAEHGLDAGLLKASFRLAADCLDKIAFFLNEYLQLGLPERRVSFNTVWHEKANTKKPTHHTITTRMEGNHFLRALRDVQRDWLRQAFPGRLKDSRNVATHRGLVLRWVGRDVQDAAAELEWTTDEFEKVTMVLLRTVKAAILYLIAFVNVEEYGRARDSGGVLAPFLFRLATGLGDELGLPRHCADKTGGSDTSQLDDTGDKGGSAPSSTGDN